MIEFLNFANLEYQVLEMCNLIIDYFAKYKSNLSFLFKVQWYDFFWRDFFKEISFKDIFFEEISFEETYFEEVFRT
jgi:hypothetical protein